MSWDIVFLIPLGLIMGVITSIAGGAGVFAVPAMLAFGLPPVDTLALNRTSDLGVLIGAARNYSKVGEGFEVKRILLVAALLSLGAFVGAQFSVRVPSDFLRWFIIFAVFVGIFFLLYPITPKESANHKPNMFLGIPVLLCVGFWSGSVGMAGATFAVLVLVTIFRYSFLKARATDIFAAIPETIISTAVLSLHAQASLSYYIAMFLSSALGAYAGSHLAVRRGSNFIRYAMVGVSVLMVIKVLYDLLYISFL